MPFFAADLGCCHWCSCDTWPSGFMSGAGVGRRQASQESCAFHCTSHEFALRRKVLYFRRMYFWMYHVVCMYHCFPYVQLSLQEKKKKKGEALL